MALPHFTEAAIQQHASDASFARGEEYYDEGAVSALVLRDNLLSAEVQGSEIEPYHVSAVFDQHGIMSASCSCPYEYGGWCKHIVAALLTCLRDPGQIEERPPLQAALGSLDREQLQALLVKLVERDPGLANTVEVQAALLTAAPPTVTAAGAVPPQPNWTPVDPKPFRRQVRSAFRGLDDYPYFGAAAGPVQSVINEAWTFIQSGDGRNGLIILDVITEEFVEGWTDLDDSDGESVDFFQELGAAWTEALLSADLTAAERRTWADKLDKWAGEVGAYGIDEAFNAAIGAAEQGWDAPPLLSVLQGATEGRPWGDEAPWYAEELTAARLNVLERQGRLEEFLRLAKSEGQNQRYALMLVRLDRIDAAAAFGQDHLTTAAEALALAAALHERGETAHALRIARSGLNLSGRKAELASWLRDLAAAQGQTELALQAARIAFEEELNLPSYLKVQDLAGDQWPDLRAPLLDRLRQVNSYSPEGPVAVFLHEGLIDDAIAAVEKGAGHVLVERVVDAAITTHPDWVIQICHQQADPIMDQGKSQYYASAARWLAKAKIAYRFANRESEWRSYLADLQARHQRKRNLTPLLKALA